MHQCEPVHGKEEGPVHGLEAGMGDSFPEEVDEPVACEI